jgi:hypothetical protein
MTSITPQFPVLGSMNTLAPQTFVQARKSKQKDIRPFSRAHMNRLVRMYQIDPLIQSAVGPLKSNLQLATINAVYQTENADQADAKEASDIENKYAREIYQPILLDILRQVLLFDFVAFRFKTIEGIKVPFVLNEQLYNPALKINIDKSIEYVAISENNTGVDNDVFIIGTGTPLLNGEIASTITPLLSGFEKSEQIIEMSMRMDHLQSQHIVVCERVPDKGNDDAVQYSRFYEADMFDMQRELAAAENMAGAERFTMHKQFQKEELSAAQIIPPEPYPLPDGYKVANTNFAKSRTDLPALNAARRSEVHSVIGVPESLVNGSGSAHAASTIASYRIMNGTLERLSKKLTTVLQAVHAFMYPDSDVKFQLEVPGLIAPEALERAYEYDIMTPADFGAQFLLANHIPLKMLNKDTSDKDFKFKLLEKRLKIEAKYAQKASPDGGGAKKPGSSSSTSTSSSSSSSEKKRKSPEPSSTSKSSSESTKPKDAPKTSESSSKEKKSDAAPKAKGVNTGNLKEAAPKASKQMKKGET